MLCIEGKLTVQKPIAGTLAHDGVINGSLRAQTGIRASLRVTEITQGSLTSAPCIRATLTGIPVNAFFSFSCPINLIESCMSLGGWNNNFGWDNDLGWKD